MYYYLADDNCRANATVTDLPDFVVLMESNVELNKDSIAGRVTARSLAWLVNAYNTHQTVSEQLCVCVS